MAQDPDEVTGAPARGAHDAADTAPSSPATTDEIRSEIEQTRADMSETIDAIQDRLSPGRLVTDAKNTVTEATLGRVKDLAETASRTAGDLASKSSETGAGVVRTARRHPVPVALVGVAATWLLVHALRRSRSADPRWQPRGQQPQGQHTAEAYRRQGESRSAAGIGRNRMRLLIGAGAGAGAGLACWGLWKNMSSRKEVR
jgi:hypothetical protein